MNQEKIIINRSACVYFEKSPEETEEEKKNTPVQIKIFLHDYKESYKKLCIDHENNKNACIYFYPIPYFTREEQSRLTDSIKIFLAKHQESYNKLCDGQKN